MSNKAKIAKYRAIISTQAREIELLQNKLLYADTYEHARLFITDLIKELEEKDEQIKAKDQLLLDIQNDINERNNKEIKQFWEVINDPYFKGLSFEQVIELAKKSIRLTDDNCEMKHKLEDIKTEVNAIYNFQVECKDKNNKEFLDKQLQKVLDIIGEDIQGLE